MTAKQKELLELIRENDKPESALMTATIIVLGFLKQHESFELPSAVGSQESC